MSASAQLPLPLAWPGSTAGEAFLISAANAAAVRHLEHPALWPVMATVLTGPPRSGRSLLGRLFACKTGGHVLDDAEALEEEAVFHAWNEAQASRRPLLIVAAARPPAWAVRLPDLASRLAATPTAAIAPPDDALFGALLARAFARRGIAVPTEVDRWLLRRIERSYTAIEDAIDRIDAAMLSGRRMLTVALVRAAIDPVIDVSSSSG